MHEGNKHIVIVQNTTLAEHYGLSSYLRNIVKNLANIPTIDLSLICLRGELNGSNCPPYVALYQIQSDTYSLRGNATFFWSTFKLLRAINAEKKIDLVHCLYPNSSVAGAVLYKLLNGGVEILYDVRSPWIHVSIERGSIHKVFAPLYKFLAYSSEFFLSIFVDKFIFITEGLYHFYKKRVLLKQKPFLIIPTGIDVDFFRTPTRADKRSLHSISSENIVVGYVGGVAKLRELDKVILAFSKIPHRAHGFRFVIIGDGNDRENLEQLTVKLGVGDKFIFTGQVSQEEIRDYLHIFDVGICHLPDTFVFRQSSPMKILEYLTAGVPVIASDILAHREAYKIFPDVSIYKNSEELTKLILAAKKPVRDTLPVLYAYDWKKIIAKITDLYLI